jgi:hypothetical protein
MKNLKTLGISLALVCVLATAAFAGSVNSPPCAPPEPGTVNSPPCAAAQITADDFVAPGETQSPPASNAGDTTSVAELAVDLLQSVLLLF